MRINYAIVFVSDMARSVAFYRDVIGLPLRFESTHWTEFDCGGASLALHLADPADAANDSASASAAGRCRPGLAVADLDAFHARMLEHSVICIEGPKSVFGARIAQYLDPDGLQFSIGEERKH